MHGIVSLHGSTRVGGQQKASANLGSAAPARMLGLAQTQQDATKHKEKFRGLWIDGLKTKV